MLEELVSDNDMFFFCGVIWRLVDDGEVDVRERLLTSWIKARNHETGDGKGIGRE